MKLKYAISFSVIISLGFMVQNAGAQVLSVDHGMLKFDTLATYEAYAENNYDRGNISRLAEESDNLTTMEEAGINPRTAENDDDLYPDFLRSILNRDRIVRISRFLVKVDLENNRALAIEADAADGYRTLADNRLSDVGLMTFSTEEENTLDIFKMIENGELTAANYRTMSSEDPEVARSCAGAARYKDDELPRWDTIVTKETSCNNYTDEYRMDNKIVYQKFIIYFSLQSKMRSLKGCTYSNFILVPLYTARLSLSGKVKYKRRDRCQTEISQANVIPFYVNSVIHWRPYEGTRALSHYDFSTKFGIRHTWSTGPMFESRVYRITSGY